MIEKLLKEGIGRRQIAQMLGIPYPTITFETRRVVAPGDSFKTYDAEKAHAHFVNKTTRLYSPKKNSSNDASYENRLAALEENVKLIIELIRKQNGNK